MAEDNKWWENRVLRSVDNLKLWVDNPRLDPSEPHENLSDFIDDLLSIEAEKKDFISLVRSIADRGFISFEPVVIWKNEKGHFVVAEGNRRVLALKLLRKPEMAPSSIRRFIREQAKLVDRDDIEKIRVCLAPSYEDTRWYVLQRHSTGSLLKQWQRLQQQRFILNAYDEQNEDVEKTIEITGLKRGEIIEALRFVGLRNLATHPDILKQLTLDEKESVYSHRISMTVLERWFGNKKVKESWGFEFDEMNIIIKSDMTSFLNAYAKLLKLMINKDNELGYTVHTRTIDNHFDDIFAALPKVSFLTDSENTVLSPEKSNVDQEKSDLDREKEQKVQEKKQGFDNADKIIKANPDRNQMVSEYLRINASSYKLNAIFKEFKLLPVNRYKNISAASLRVFLDLAVDEFIKTEDLGSALAKQENMAFGDVPLQKRLRFIQDVHIKDKQANKVIRELLNHTNQHSLNTLNEYIHGSQVHKVSRRFLNGFWDMLAPLFEVLVELKEK